MAKKRKKFRLWVYLLMIAPLFVGLALVLLPSRSSPCANSISCIKDLSGEVDQTKTVGEFRGLQVSVPSALLEELSAPSPILGVQTKPNEKKIYVNLTTQQLYAYEGNKLIYNFTISSGSPNPTPVGKFYIWVKLLSTDMEGGEKVDNTYYNLPNVPYTMYFYNENVGKWNGYGIHGAYWPMQYGKAMSNGCVVLRVSDAGKLYRWAEPETSGKATFAKSETKGTPVIIYGKAPL